MRPSLAWTLPAAEVREAQLFRQGPLDSVRHMSTARVGDHELFYERSGAGEPLLLIMGMSGTHLSWGGPFLDALRRDFEIAIYDHRGIGKSSRAEPPYTIGDLAEDAAG